MSARVSARRASRELYTPVFGNPNLKPEESLGWDVGLEQPLAKDKLRIGATFFHNDFDNLIDRRRACRSKTSNRARTLGVETFATWKPLTNVTFRAAYTWLDTEGLEYRPAAATSPRTSRQREHELANPSAAFGGRERAVRRRAGRRKFLPRSRPHESLCRATRSSISVCGGR